MQGNRKLTETTLLAAALLTSLFFVGTARAQGPPAYIGKFTLTDQIHWGKSVLQPGNYTITIKSLSIPTIALVTKVDGDAFTYVMSGARNGNTNGVNALLIKEKDGQLTVHSLALADLGMVLIYEPALAHERPVIQEARSARAVAVTSAKK